MTTTATIGLHLRELVSRLLPQQFDDTAPNEPRRAGYRHDLSDSKFLFLRRSTMSTWRTLTQDLHVRYRGAICTLCPTCARSRRQSISLLRRHRLRHNGGRPLQCTGRYGRFLADRCDILRFAACFQMLHGRTNFHFIRVATNDVCRPLVFQADADAGSLVIARAAWACVPLVTGPSSRRGLAFGATGSASNDAVKNSIIMTVGVVPKA